MTATLIAAHTRVAGSIVSDGDLVIEGHVDGSVRAAGLLTLGRNAQVTGAIEAHDVRIAGRLDRGIVAAGVVHLLASAEVHGDLDAGRVIIDDGALFEGQVRLTRAAAAVASLPSTRLVPELPSPGRRRIQRRPA